METARRRRFMFPPLSWSGASARDDFELHLAVVDGAGADHDVEPAGLDRAPHVEAEERELVGREVERERLALARHELHAPEVLQLDDGARHGADEVRDVELRDLLAR